MRSQLSGHIDAIGEVRVGVTKYAAKFVKTTYPVDIESSKFSVPYVIATSLVNGTPRLSTFTEAGVHDPTEYAGRRRRGRLTLTPLREPAQARRWPCKAAPARRND